MPFGKHRGKDLRDVPDSYLIWVLDNCAEISPTLRRAIEDRLGLNQPKDPGPGAAGGTAEIEKVIRAWHRQMTMKYHPDRGGGHEQMILVNEGAELFRRLAGL